LNDSAKKDAFLGSYLVPDKVYIKSFVSRLHKNCAEAVSKKDKDLVVAHNAMAMYTLQMLSFATGHRDVNDPFCDLNIFDITNGTVLIEDKVVSSVHQTRLSWLPHLATLQLEHYLSHLRSLSRFIRNDNPNLADRIWAITEPDYSHPIPLFFMLHENDETLDWHSIQPLTIENMLRDCWILPLNSNRHLLSTWLHCNGCPTEVIDAQLGHIESGCSPFGSRSALDPVSIGRIAKTYLQKYLDVLEWQEVKGLSAPSRLRVMAPKIGAKILKTNSIFGPAARAVNKEVMWLKDAEAVLNLADAKLPRLDSIPDTSPYPTIADPEVEALENELIEKSPGGRTLIRLTLFRRHLLKLKRKGVIIKVPGRLATGHSENSCFDLNSTRAASQLESIKGRFLDYLSSSAGETVEEERRIAEILISSIIFSAQTSSKFQDIIAKGFRKSTFRIGDEITVDVSSSPSSPIRRWMPDKTSWALLIGYWKNLKQDAPVHSNQKVIQHVGEILLDINAPLPGGKSFKYGISKLLAPLSALAQSSWRLCLPGVIRAYAEGEFPCASVLLANWLRLITGESGTLPSTKNELPKHVQIDETVPIRNLQPDDATNYGRAKECWETITKILGMPKKNKKTNIENGFATGVESEKTNIHDVRSNARKKKIIRGLYERLNDQSNTFPIIGQLVAAWVIHLCRHGTSHKPVIRANTVTSYGRTIGERLITLAYEENFLALPDLAVEEIYRKVLQTSSDENRLYVASRLKEFHLFLVCTYGMPEIDWSEVIDDDLIIAEAVDSGIVTLDEYGRALEILSGGKDCTDKDRLLNVAVLFFGYRFGLRTGEIFRLTISDIIMDDEMVVYVRNSVYGETKTDNGIRQLPLLGPFSDLERILIARWFSHVETYADGDPLAILLPKLKSQRNVVDRSSSVNDVVEVLRSVTGDKQTRLRHLRHTCATRLFLAMLLEKIPNGLLGQLYMRLWGEIYPEEIRTNLTGDKNISRRGLYAMALYMGHGSPDMTHQHYVHLAEVVLAEWIRKNMISIDDKALAYAYQASYANIRKLRSRNRIESFQDSALAHFTRQSEIPTPKLSPEVKKEVYSLYHSLPERSFISPATIDRLLLLATMRNSVDGLADRFLITGRMVISTLLSAATLQEQTGFTDFAIPESNSDDSWTHNATTRYPFLEKESQRVRRFLESIERSVQDPNVLAAGIKIWASGYHPHSKSLLIKKRSDLSELLSTMKYLGIPLSDLEINIPGSQAIDEHQMWMDIGSELSIIGLKVKWQKRLPMSNSKTQSDSRVGLTVRASKSHELGYQRTLNRTLFVISIWLMLKNS
jgi:integrase